MRPAISLTRGHGKRLHKGQLLQAQLLPEPELGKLHSISKGFIRRGQQLDPLSAAVLYKLPL